MLKKTVIIKRSLCLTIAIIFLGCRATKISDKSFTSKTISIQKVKDHVYQHISYLNSETFGRVSCNGMVVFNQGEAIIFDTPIDDSTSAELINWVRDSLKSKVIAIIPTHFHEDCVGGLAEFHKRRIPSFATNKTIALAKSRNFKVPQHGFDNLKEFKAGNKKVVAEFNGEGHTRDNIIGYFPSEKVMFGGCPIKEIDAGKGNLEDANINAWPATVRRIKEKYWDTAVVIPGHGKSGDTALLDFTIKLFQ